MNEEIEEAGLKPPPRDTWGLLTDRRFGPYVASKLVSAMGMWVNNIVMAVVVFQMTGSALLVGAVSIAQFLPQMLLAPAAGAHADRGDRVRQLVLGRLTSAAAGGLLALWVGLVGVQGLPGPQPVIAAAGVIGIGFAISSPAMHAILPAMVGPSELPAAVALNHVPHTLARATGPALGAMVLALGGPSTAFAFAALANLAHALATTLLRPRALPQRDDADRSVRAGLRHVRADSVCLLLLVGVAAVGVGIDPVITLTPPLAAQLGGADALVGWLVTAFGAGSALVVFVGPLRRALGVKRMNPVGMGLFASGYVVLALAPDVALSLVGLMVAGMGMMLAITSLTTQLQARLPDELRGRVMALWAVAFLGSRPVGASINGAIADHLSVEAALVVMVMMLLTGAVISRPSRVGQFVWE